MKQETAVQLKDDAGQHAALPIPIQYADDVRFQKPEQPTYPILPSIFSILSLLFMATLSSVMFIQLFNPAVTGLAWLGWVICLPF
jgi:bifunctional DNase/RNase